MKPFFLQEDGFYFYNCPKIANKFLEILGKTTKESYFWSRNKNRSVAQLVEQLTLNQRAQGSNPCRPTVDEVVVEL